VSLTVTRLRHAKTAKWINVQSGLQQLHPRHILLDRKVPIPYAKEGGFDAAFAKLLWPLDNDTFYQRKKYFQLCLSVCLCAGQASILQTIHDVPKQRK